jgi:putative transposase
MTLVAAAESRDEIVARLEAKIAQDLNSYPAHIRAYALNYAAYLKEIDASHPGDLRTKFLKATIAKVAAKIGDTDPPSPRSLRRRYPTWIDSDRDPRSQVPGFEKRGNRDRYSPGFEWLMRLSLDTTHLTDQRMHITEARKFLMTWVEALNSKDEKKIGEAFKDVTYGDKKDPKPALEAEEVQQLQLEIAHSKPIVVPCKATFYRRVNQISQYDILVAQYGKRYADSVFRTSMPGPRATRPLERVDADMTTTDLMVIDEALQVVLGRAHVYVFWEEFCRGPLGQYLGFEPESELAVMSALRNSILPKTYVKEEYPSIKHSWEFYGVPDLVNLDNAMAVHSADFEQVGEPLGMIFTYDPPKMPWFKGMIERFFRTLNEKLLHAQRGTTFSCPLDLVDYDPEKNAIIPLGMLRLMFHKWIIDILLQTPGRGIKDLPSRRWANYVDELPPLLPAQAKELDVLLGRRLVKPLWHYGIELHELYYNSPELGQLRKRTATKQTGPNPHVLITAPQGDLSRIHVQDPADKCYIEVPATNQDYTRGLTLWSHQINLKYCKKYLDGVTDEVALSRAQVEIWQMFFEASRVSKEVARYLEDHSNPNSTGPLIAHARVEQMLREVAGHNDSKSIESQPAPAAPTQKVADLYVDPGEDEVPDIESSQERSVLSDALNRDDLEENANEKEQERKQQRGKQNRRAS